MPKRPSKECLRVTISFLLVMMLFMGSLLFYVYYYTDRYPDLKKERDAVVRRNNQILTQHNALYNEHRELSQECYTAIEGIVKERDKCLDLVNRCRTDIDDCDSGNMEIIEADQHESLASATSFIVLD